MLDNLKELLDDYDPESNTILECIGCESRYVIISGENYPYDAHSTCHYCPYCGEYNIVEDLEEDL